MDGEHQQPQVQGEIDIHFVLPSCSFSFAFFIYFSSFLITSSAFHALLPHFCKVVDVVGVSALVDAACAKHKVSREQVVTVVDATWSTPVLQNPLVQGADIVLHSLTK
jgi:hypothetical protein